MKRATLLVCLSLALLANLAVAADTSRDNINRIARADSRSASQVNGIAVSVDKAAADTVYVLGGPGTVLGKFQDSSGTIPNQQNWITVDRTLKNTVRWNVSTFNAANLDPSQSTNYAIWCGQVFAEACGPTDVPEGYGNYWDECYDYYGTVADPTVPTAVRVQAMLNHDTEPGYDYLMLEYETATGMSIAGDALDASNGDDALAFDRQFTIGVPDYVGTGHNQVHLRWHATSDVAWSDEDCLWATSGHCQIDNILVSFNGVQAAYDDFQPGNPLHWTVVFPPAVGDFSKVWPRLADIDPCAENNTPQFAFIDDGIVVPGTGGTLGTSWTYGPSGYTVNLLGGMAGPNYLLYNEIWSPVLDWPTGAYDAGTLDVDVWSHLPTANGLYYIWSIRDSADGGATWSQWSSDGWVYYGSANYVHRSFILDTYMQPARNKLQVCLGAMEVDWWDEYGTDGTPAPYFDNVAVRAFAASGPAISGRGIDMFNDGWPVASAIDYVNLANNSVRVDMALNIAQTSDLRNDPGDSMVLNVVPVRTGSHLNSKPTLNVIMKANPLFNGVRVLPLGFVQVGNRITGAVSGALVKVNGVTQKDKYCWDLPDSSFFYPGDVIHYYIKAQDNLSGDIRTTLLPGDTTGIALFPGDVGYQTRRISDSYKIKALPTMFSANVGAQPHLLFWNDSHTYGVADEFYGALDNLGYRQGTDYDVYTTIGPSSGVGNGLGGRTNHLKMSGYNTLLYSSANLTNFTFSNGDFSQDPGNDIAVVDAWLSLGGRNMFATGDNIIQDLSTSGVNAVLFRDKWFSVNLNAGDVRPLIGGQTTPTVSPITVAGAPVLSRSYLAYGSCPGINDFDAVTPAGAAVRIAQFTSPTGAVGVYPYAAAIYNYVAASTARVVYLPYDLGYIYTVGTSTSARPARADILLDVLAFFGELPGGPAVGVTPELAFTSRNYPNPFNPSTKIEFTLPRAGQVELKIYNVRGELVKTLLDESRDAGRQSVIWDGRNASGGSVSSGVYFYSLKSGGLEKMEKMTLVK